MVSHPFFDAVGCFLQRFIYYRFVAQTVSHMMSSSRRARLSSFSCPLSQFCFCFSVTLFNFSTLALYALHGYHVLRPPYCLLFSAPLAHAYSRQNFAERISTTPPFQSIAKSEHTPTHRSEKIVSDQLHTKKSQFRKHPAVNRHIEVPDIGHDLLEPKSNRLNQTLRSLATFNEFLFRFRIS